MFELKDRFIGDIWPYYEAEKKKYHIFFLSSPLDKPKGNWRIDHVSGHDLKNWEYHGAALEAGNEGDFDDKGLATGSIIKHKNKYYMSYTGHSKSEPLKGGSIGIAVSDDLFTWTKLSNKSLLDADPELYETEITGSRPFLHWRDPFLVEDNGLFHMLICARNKSGPVMQRGTVAHGTSSNLIDWKIEKALAVVPFCEEMECPLLYKINGIYYLLYSTHKDLIDPSCLEEKERKGGLFCQVADKLEGPYRDNRRIPLESEKGYFYALRLIVSEKRYHLIGTVINDEKKLTYISDAIEVDPEKDGFRILDDKIEI